MASSSQPAKSLLSYYGPKSSLDGLKLNMPVTPEEVRARSFTARVFLWVLLTTDAASLVPSCPAV